MRVFLETFVIVIALAGMLGMIETQLKEAVKETIKEEMKKWEDRHYDDHS